MLWLTITVDENEDFFHWLVSDHKPWESSGSAKADIQKSLNPQITATISIGVQYPDGEISLCIQEYFEYSPKWRRLHDADKRNIEGWLLEEAHGK